MIDTLPLERWEGRRAVELAREWGVPGVHLFASVGSTNDVARWLGDEGAPSGSVVLAEEQTAGRGRSGRSWASAPGLGLWLSVLLRPTAAPNLALTPLWVGLAVARALERFVAPLHPQIKWPNDILLDGRKAAGILCEGSWESDQRLAVVAGLGVNVLHTRADFPPELQPLATSLVLAGAPELSRLQLAGALVREVLELAGSAPAELGGPFAAELRARDALFGQAVTLGGPGAAELEGVAEGIAPDGALRVRAADGALHEVRSGSVLRYGSPEPRRLPID